MKEMLFHDCAHYSRLIDLCDDENLNTMYSNRFVALYDIINKLNLVDEFVQYSIEFEKQFEEDC